MVLILRHDDILASLSPVQFMDELREYHGKASSESRAEKVRAALPGSATAVVLMPGLLSGIPAYTVKVNAKFPGTSPAIKGLVCLHALADGELLALADSSTVTAWRTGLSAALATHLFAHPDADTVAIVGAGAQANTTLHGLLALRTLRRVVIADPDSEAAGRFAARWRDRIRDVDIKTHARAAAADAEIVISATWSRDPVLRLADLGAGQHVTSLGADEAGKRELGDDILAHARLFVDDRVLAASHGVLTAGATTDAIELGEVVRGECAGRTRPEDLTVYAPVGLPWLDLALTWRTYVTARERGIGQTMNSLW
jgi:alanine dehydrogenase